MNYSMLYENDEFVLVHVTYRHPPAPGKAKGKSDYGYEVINKREMLYAYISGRDAMKLAQHIKMWRENIPQEEEVISTIGTFAAISCCFPLAHH